MKKIVLLSALFSVLTVSAQATDEAAVKVSINKAADGFTLTCVPQKPIGELPEHWVALCNQQAHAILKHESSHGNPVKVISEPFGMAGQFAAQSAASLAAGVTPQSITSPDLTLDLQ